MVPQTKDRWLCQCESSPACGTVCFLHLIVFREKKLRNPPKGRRDSNGKQGPHDAGHMRRVTGLGPGVFTLRIILRGLYHNGGLFVIYMRTAQKACASIRRPPRTRVGPFVSWEAFVFVLTSFPLIADVAFFQVDRTSRNLSLLYLYF